MRLKVNQTSAATESWQTCRALVTAIPFLVPQLRARVSTDQLVEFIRY